MFVDKPLPAPRREELKQKAEEVRDEILRKVDQDLLDILKDKGIHGLDEGDITPDDDLGEDWIRFRPGEKLNKVEPGDSSDTKKPSAQDLISRFDEDIQERGMVSKEGLKTLRKAKKGKRPKRSKGKMPKGIQEDHVDVINIVENGVYEINLEGLLDDSPIVVQKDGSYLIHLPSLFNSRKKKTK